MRPGKASSLKSRLPLQFLHQRFPGIRSKDNALATIAADVRGDDWSPRANHLHVELSERARVLVTTPLSALVSAGGLRY
jgi:hypothetical protein